MGIEDAMVDIETCDECVCSSCDYFGFDCDGLCVVCSTTDKTKCADYFPIEGLEGSETE